MVPAPAKNDGSLSVSAGCEITENYLVSFWNPTPKIWVSEILSGFPRGSGESFRKPCLYFYRVSGQKPL